MSTTRITHQKPKSIYDVFERKDGNQVNTHYCPGCGHGILHKIIGNTIDELGIQDKTIFISPVGCSVFCYYYFDVGNIQAAHGRAPAVAVGAKRAKPDSILISYQGDGDLAAIGTAEIIHAANRGERITVFFVNNVIYGMTGGQMAPTTLIGQKTTTSPYGRSVENEGYPIKVCELLAALEAPVYLERVALTDPANINKTKRAVKKALKSQADGQGFSLVEVLSPCPVGWKMTPEKSKQWIVDVLYKQFPLGCYRDNTATAQPVTRKSVSLSENEFMDAIGVTSPDPAARGAPKTTPLKGFENPRLKISGFGGQGVLTMGLLFCNAGMLEGKNVTWLPSYGPESRGGTSNCHVKIDSEEIGSPLVTACDVLLAMNGPSYEKFISTVAPNGLVLYESDLVTPDESKAPKGVRLVGMPSTRLAEEAGSAKAVNVVNFGAVTALLKLASKENALQSLKVIFPNPKFQAANEKAFEAGYAYGTKHSI